MKKIILMCVFLSLANPAISANYTASEQQMGGSCSAYNQLGLQMMPSNMDKNTREIFSQVGTFMLQFRNENNPALFDMSYKVTMEEAKRTIDMAGKLRDQNMYQKWLSKGDEACTSFLVNLKNKQKK